MYSAARIVQTQTMQAESLFAYKDILIILGVAGLIMPVLLRIGVNSILGFLVIGLLLGPHVLGQLALHFAPLRAFGLSDVHAASGMAELGVVFLLFLIGLELSPERLRTMRRLVFGLGGLQIAISTPIIALLAYLVGYGITEAFIIGMALALSSTAIVIQLFSDKKRLGTVAGRISFAVLLMQDLAVIPMLLLVSALGNQDSTNLLQDIAWAFMQAILAATIIVIVGRYALRPILRFVAATKSPDLFMAIVLFIAMGTGAAATLAGLSMSIGAFIAGLMLAETEYRRAIEAILEPFKGLLLGLFFLLVGLNLDLGLMMQSPLQIVSAALLVVIVKFVIVMGLSTIFKLPRRSTFEAALLLGPGGEFAIVLLAAASSVGFFKANGTSPILLVVSLGLIAIPLLSALAGFLLKTFKAVGKHTAMPFTVPSPQDLAQDQSHIIVAGFGRVGSLVAAMLEEQKLAYVAVDMDVETVTAARKRGMKTYYGDAANAAFLEACGIATAKCLAITMDNPARVDEILRIARNLRPDLKIIARARDERHAIRLYQAGVTEAIPETIEASLQLGEAVLVESGVPMGLAIAAVHERRDGFRKLLGRPDRRLELSRARKQLRAQLKD